MKLLFVFDYLIHLTQNDSEMFGRTLRVNMAKPMKLKEGSSRAGN